MEWEKIRNIVSEMLEIRPEDVHMDSSFFEDFGADSLDVDRIITAIEDVFSVEISDLTSGYMPQTVGALYNRVSELLGLSS